MYVITNPCLYAHKADPQDPPKSKQKLNKQNYILWISTEKSLSDYFHILHIVEMIAEKKDGCTTITEDPPPPPQLK